MAYTIEASNRVYENVRSYFEAGNGVQNYALLEVVYKLGENRWHRIKRLKSMQSGPVGMNISSL